MTVTAAQTNFYLNGILHSSGGGITNGSNSQPLLIGTSYSTPCSTELDEVQIFSRALQQSEIEDIYNAGSAGKCKCVDPPTDMVAWWPLNEIAPTTTANDIALFNNVGTHMNGPTPMPGEVAGALLFDGVNDFVQVADQAELNFGTGDFSIDAWVKRSTSSVGPIVEKALGGINTQGYSFWITPYNPGVLGFSINDGSTYFGYSTTGVPVGVWTHVAVTVKRNDPTGIKFYVDGSAAGTLNPTSRPGSLTNAGMLFIGKSNSFFPFPGLIDEVELFDRALTSTEILNIFQAGSAGKCRPCVDRPPDMAAWWPLNELMGGTATDVVGGHNGTHFNGPTPLAGQYVDNSLCFDGIDDYVDAPDGSTGPGSLNVGVGNFSIDAWVKRDLLSPPSLPSVIVDKRDSGTDIGYSLSVSFGRLYLSMDDGVFLNSGTTGTECVPADGLWHFVAVTVNRTTGGGQFYCDCNPRDTFTPRPGNLDNTNVFRIGMGERPGNRPWFGCIDELELFKRALTLQEIQSICSAGSGGKCVPANDIDWNPTKSCNNPGANPSKACTIDADCGLCTLKKCSGLPANTTCTGTCPAGQTCNFVDCTATADCTAVSAGTCTAGPAGSCLAWPNNNPKAATRSLVIAVTGPTTPSKVDAIKVTMIDLQHPKPANLPSRPPPNFTTYDTNLNGVCNVGTLVGHHCDTDADCPGSVVVGRCSSLVACTADPVCTNSAACTLPSNSCARWVGKPGTFLEAQDVPLGATCRAARLQCTPFYHDWKPEGPICVFGAEIVPSSQYSVQTYSAECMGNEAACTEVSAPVTMYTRRYGDVAVVYNPPGTTTQPDAIDVAQLVNKIKNLAGALGKCRAQLQPNLPELNADINALDIVAVVDAVKQKAYALSGPCPCPSLAVCGALACSGSSTCIDSALPGLGTGAMCVKTCSGPGPLAGDPCINNTHCVGSGTCGSGFCRDRCGRCTP